MKAVLCVAGAATCSNVTKYLRYHIANTAAAAIIDFLESLHCLAGPHWPGRLSRLVLPDCLQPSTREKYFNREIFILKYNSQSRALILSSHCPTGSCLSLSKLSHSPLDGLEGPSASKK